MSVHLHIGAMKTGTSYIQSNLDLAQSALADAGVLYPGRVGAAVHDVLEKRGARHLGSASGSWSRLVETIHAWHGPSAIVSMEFLALATTAQVGLIVDSLRPADVRVVLTARDLARAVPSAWQQTTKNRKTVSWEEFLAALVSTNDHGDRVRERFWRHHDLAAIARTWVGVVGPDRLTVVTVPPSGEAPHVLWDRFCSATGLDVNAYPTALAKAVNSSLGFAEAEMMRRLNVELGRGIEQPAYRRIVTEFISGDVLRGTAERTLPPTLPDDVYHWAVRRSAALRGDLEALGVRVVGDLADLVPLERERDSRHDLERQADPNEVANVAIRAVAALVARLADEGEAQPSAALDGAGIAAEDNDPLHVPFPGVADEHAREDATR